MFAKLVGILQERLVGVTYILVISDRDVRLSGIDGLCGIPLVLSGVLSPSLVVVEIVAVVRETRALSPLTHGTLQTISPFAFITLELDFV